MAQIADGTAPVVLDVRSKKEFDAGHIPGAIHRPFWRIDSRWRTLGRYARESGSAVLRPRAARLHCRSRAEASRVYKVTYLEGHMKKWKQLRLPIVLALIAFMLAPARGSSVAQGLPPARGTQQADVRMVSVEGEGAKYWPVWRGPSGQGIVNGTGYPETWSATENVAWKKPVGGRGNSSPIVWGDRIFLTTAYDGGRRVSLLAFRRSDGMQLWETFAPQGETGMGSSKERSCIRDSRHRRQAGVRIVWQPWSRCRRSERQAGLAS